MSVAVELLNYLEVNDELKTHEFAEEFKLDHQTVIGALKSLESTEKAISDMMSYKKLVVTDEGSRVAKNGSYEYQVYTSIPPQGIKREELIKLDNGLLGFNKAMSQKWIEMNESSGEKLIYRKKVISEDQVCLDLRAIENEQFVRHDATIKEYKKRQLVKDIDCKYFLVKKGPKFTLINDRKLISVLTAEVIKELDGNIDDVEFKPFNVPIGANLLRNSNLNPLLKYRNKYAEIFVEMGFKEMPRNNFIESSFWNFDALFQPQDHPARDSHDTFFISETDTVTTDQIPMEYLHRVQQVHSNGGYGSQGYKNPWRIEEAQKNLLRTHTTAVSARMLYQLAQQKQFEPVKYFSIDRVFRNETLDATHLAEFHQVEGLIADRGVNLGNLKFYVRKFFQKLGMHKLRFKPAYNPYTEPSMEIFGYHEGLKKWIELGNSGMFRPEMLLPMGLPEDVNVIAWGLSLERPAMIKYGCNDIREMFGPKIDFSKIYSSPICRLDE